eukprot:gene21615-52928_t
MYEHPHACAAQACVVCTALCVYASSSAQSHGGGELLAIIHIHLE